MTFGRPDGGTAAPDGFPMTFHHTDNWVIVGKGEAPNFNYKANGVFTVNANRETPADFFKEKVSCK